ncbi:MAG: hypothetical protein KAX49_04480 [Halanaerobiales bacterium]|nr:hypothetical protein [Halanaerobiales bacterium]
MRNINKLLILTFVVVLIISLFTGCSMIKKQEDVKGTVSGSVYFGDELLADSDTMTTTVTIEQDRLLEPQTFTVDENGVYSFENIWAGTPTTITLHHESDKYLVLDGRYDLVFNKMPMVYDLVIEGWRTPASLPFNTDKSERMPWFDEETKTLFYVNSAYDICYTIFDETTDQWSTPELIPGEVNDFKNCISPVKRGNHLYFGGPSYKYNVYMATWDGSKWTDVQVVEGLSDEGNNWHFWIDESETLAYYVSNASGNYDIYKAHKEGDIWVKDGKVEGLSTDGAEKGIFYEENEGKFYVLSNKDGNYDIYVADSEDSELKIVPGINSLGTEGIFWTNGETMFVTISDNGRDIAISEIIK